MAIPSTMTIFTNQNGLFQLTLKLFMTSPRLAYSVLQDNVIKFVSLRQLCHSEMQQSYWLKLVKGTDEATELRWYNHLDTLDTILYHNILPNGQITD